MTRISRFLAAAGGFRFFAATGSGFRFLAAAGIAVGALGATPRPASACGGFFCSQAQVDQSGEQIVFSLHDKGVTAHIQIQFQGNAKDFAWVVPVMSQPRIGLGTQAMFSALQQQTMPRFNVNWGDGGGGSCFGRPESAQSAGAGGVGGDKSVSVLESKELGPYDIKVVHAKNPDDLFTWLKENGYDQPPEARPLFKYYVDNNFVFVALKLKQNATVGEIQPLTLDMDHPEACVPLILTRIAALPDMPVLVYMLGKHRAVPKNWFEVELNWKKVNWLDGGSNYRQVVTDAINEASGRAFVTEYAGDSAFMKGRLYTKERYDVEKIRPLTDPGALVQFLFQNGYPRDATMQALLRKHIPMPASLMGVDERTFYNSLAFGGGPYAALLAGTKVDTAAFIRDLEERIIAPLEAAQKMFDAQPYLTRLFSTISKEEMTRDPLFTFNPDLPKVSNVHTAQGYAACVGDGAIANVRLVLPNKEEVRLTGPIRLWGGTQEWPVARGEPVARRITLAAPQGPSMVYTRAQAVVVDQLLDRESPESVRTRPEGQLGRPVEGGGCSVGGAGGGGAGLGLLGLLGLAFRRRLR